MSDVTRDAVLLVLQGQGPDYYAFPNASAFHAEGLDPVAVADVLEELHQEGLLEREQIDQGEGVEPLPGGYRLAAQKPKRRKKT